MYANKNRMICNVSKDSKLENININIPLCESCIERNLFEVSTYVYKCSLKRPTEVIDSDEKFNSDNEDMIREVKKPKNVIEYVEKPNISEEAMSKDKKKARKTKKDKLLGTEIIMLDN